MPVVYKIRTVRIIKTNFRQNYIEVWGSNFFAVKLHIKLQALLGFNVDRKHLNGYAQIAVSERHKQRNVEASKGQ